ncbi:hypothetical protein P4V43_04460 [Brevibacillus fortis]|uniref:Uncharacterized protein n=1 Tax=Brevibacillus fortis TaxID=2126352 RepID=A0A2P7UKH1_9BACL|nr:hypothetical protein [Brevibacillus fortis]MED1781069.1 hypothetical protein [Brevibacillus fortis]PSJ87501.1 hypothetical protein C7R93_26705 [Brevibacillus fortis]
MNIGRRVLAAVLSSFFTGLYAAWIIYIYRDPSAPYGFGQEYLLGVLLSMALNLIVFVWLSIFVDWLVSRSLHLIGWKKYAVRFGGYAVIGYVPVLLQWLLNVDPHAALFYPQATVFVFAAISYFLIFLGIEAIRKRFTRKTSVNRHG